MTKLTELLDRFPHLPDDAVVHSKVTSAVTGLSERTIRYDPRFERVYVSATRYGQRVRDIKKVLAGGFKMIWKPIGDAARDVAEKLGPKVGTLIVRDLTPKPRVLKVRITEYDQPVLRFKVKYVKGEQP